MKKVLFAFLFVILGLSLTASGTFLFVGCSNSQSENGDGETSNPEENDPSQSEDEEIAGDVTEYNISVYLYNYVGSPSYNVYLRFSVSAGHSASGTYYSKSSSSSTYTVTTVSNNTSSSVRYFNGASLGSLTSSNRTVSGSWYGPSGGYVGVSLYFFVSSSSLYYAADVSVSTDGWYDYAVTTPTTYSSGGSFYQSLYPTTSPKDAYVSVAAAQFYAKTLNANGGTLAASSFGGSSTYTYYKRYGSSISIYFTSCTRTGYTFLGYNTSSTATTVSYSGGTNYTLTSNSNQTFYAVWQINTYRLTINYYGGTDRQSNATDLEVYGVTLSSGEQTIIAHTYTTTNQTFTFTLSNGSYDYYMRTGSEPTTSSYTQLYDSSSDSYTYSWKPTSSVTLNVYVKQRYTISFNANNGSGTTPSSIYKIHGTAVTLPDNDLTRTGFTANGWNTNSSGTGTAYSSGGSYSTNATDTLYADWTAKTLTVRVRLKASTDGSTFSNSNAGGTTTVRYYYSSNNSVYSGSVSVTGSSLTTVASNALAGYSVVFTPTANSGYVYLGVTTSSTTAPSSQSTSVTPTTAGGTYTYYLYFKVKSSFELKYDSADDYFYFENGVFPQSYVGTSMNSTLTTAYSNGNTTQSGRIQYNNGLSTPYIYIYTYNSNRYARVQATSTQTLTMSNGTFTFNSGTYYWFEVEPIRWRLSNYGVSSTSYPSGWSTFGTYKTNFSVVSDRVLMIGAVENASSVTEGWAYTSSDLYTNTSRFSNGASTNNFFAEVSSGTVSGYNYKFGDAGQQVKVESVSSSLSGIRVASIEEIDDYTSDFSAKASDMVCLLLGCGTDEFVDYWTRNLGTGLGNGQIITKAGEEKSTWLNTLKGVRFAVTMPSGSRV